MCSTLIGSGLTRKDLTMLEYLQSTHCLAYLALFLVFLTLATGAQKLMGDNQKVVWIKFPTLRWAVLLFCTIKACHTYRHF